MISVQLEQFLEAIVKYCEPYLAMDCAAKHVRHAISLTYPSVMHTPSPDPIGLVPVGVKRKYEHCDSLGAMGPPVRKLAYQPPRPLGTSRWPIRPARVSSMPMSGFTSGGCAAESSALRVARPYAVRACYPYRTVLRVKWDVVCRVFEICVMLTCVYARLGTIAAIHQSLMSKKCKK